MGRARRRRHAKNSTPFRAWGLTLTVLAALLATQKLWPQMLLCLGALVFYLAVVRLNRCRVETQYHKPCKWLVRGMLGTCTYHVGYKRALPTLMRGDNFLGLPTFMWPRDDFARTRPESQPEPGARGQKAMTGATAKRPGYDWAMMAFAGLSALVGVATLIKEFAAG